jgi:hypothetical protein
VEYGIPVPVGGDGVGLSVCRSESVSEIGVSFKIERRKTAMMGT